MKKLFVLLSILIAGLAVPHSDAAPKDNYVAPPFFATACVNIPNGNLADIRDTLCAYWGYTGNPNDNTAKTEFLRAQIARYVKNQYITAKGIYAAEAAKASSDSTTNQVDIN